LAQRASNQCATEEARAIVDPALRLMMDAIHHYGGYVAQSTGDGIFALFGTSPKRVPQNTLIVQPVLALHLWGKWYLRSAEGDCSVGWRRHYPTTLPLSLGVGRTLVRPGLPPHARNAAEMSEN
jgi:class 3 adenylate cyclase